MRFLDKYFRKFFRNKKVKWLVAHVCLFIAASIVLSDTLFVLNECGVIHFIFGPKILFASFFGTGYFLLLPLGFYIFTRRFCAWSKDSFYLILIYSFAHTIHKHIIHFNLTAEIILNAVLLVLSFMIIFNLIRKK